MKQRNNKKDYINDILEAIDPDIISISKIYNFNFWEEIAQETRIHMWQIIDNNYIKKMTAEEIYSGIDDILLNCRNLLLFYANISRKSVIREHTKYYNSNLNIDDLGQQLSYNFAVHRIEFEIDYKKYCDLLDGKELKFFKYICENNPSQINYDELSRQLGYSSKNGLKYNLTKIAQKIAAFEEKNS